MRKALDVRPIQMKRRRSVLLVLVAWFLTMPSSLSAAAVWDRPLPWREAGLSERQAARILLERLTFGPRPGDVDRVLEMGFGQWIEAQLAGDFPGPAAARLARLPLLELPQKDLLQRFWLRLRVFEEAQAQGLASDDGSDAERRRHAMARATDLSEERGYHSADTVLSALQAQKLLRAVYSESQLVEVLTDLWLNHFNVSSDNPFCRLHLLSYERDALRPRVLGSFRELLGATARHPAMLIYLGNASSFASDGVTTTFDLAMDGSEDFSPGQNPTSRARLAYELGWRDRQRRPYMQTAQRGLNENYARELMELHTLGVDGGYRQSDVIEVARAFTGWTTFPLGHGRPKLERVLATAAEVAPEMGFVVEDEFLFRPDYHDAEIKTVLGTTLPAGRGIEDGEEVLDLLARQGATARRVATRLAVRFVADAPPLALVERLAETFEVSGGDLREMMRALVASPEFWSEASQRRKVKSPFELVVSALRAVDAEIEDTAALNRWLTRMGQPLYGYGAPTGYPEYGSAWIHVGPMLARINFAFDLAGGRLKGVAVDHAELTGGKPPTDLEEALRLYLPYILPEMDPGDTLLRLLEHERQLAAKAPVDGKDGAQTDATPAAQKKNARARKRAEEALVAYTAALLLASPEFQRR